MWFHRCFEAWSMNAREWRHNRCLMTPLTSIGLLVMGLFWLVVFVLKFPTLILGMLLTPCLSRSPFVIEFLYPTALGRFLHLTVCRMVMRSKMSIGGIMGAGGEDKNHGSHSRTLETRIEVIPGRVYIHPLPQLLDNLGYLVVCCPETSHNNNKNTNNGQPLPKNSTRTSGYHENENEGDEGFEQEEILCSNTTMTTLGKITIAPAIPKTKSGDEQRIVAFIVDCGDAQAVQQQLQLICKRHYKEYEMIHVQAILSTHKHHDHTAGNLAYLRLPTKFGRYLKLIVGGAVEQVPGCNYAVTNGQYIPLPKHGDNVMNDLVHVEAVATPGHTRGSMTYVLRPNNNNSVKKDHHPHANTNNAAAGLAYLFTGDTVFSGGGGVPFEADLDPGQEEQEAKQTFASFINASAAGHAVERCFSEILARILPEPTVPVSTTLLSSSAAAESFHTTPTSTTMSIMDFAALANRSFIFPGHEYTQELLGRQLRPQGSGSSSGGGGGSSGGGSGEAGKWRNFAPSYFFETASHFYLAMHRRGLPQSNGKLVTAICSPVGRELYINPVFRTLRRRAEVLVPAISAWNRRFARHKVSSQSILAAMDEAAAAALESRKNGQGPDEEEQLGRQNYTTTRSTEDCWNLNSADLSRSVFCTVYTSDMEMLVADLAQNRISTATAARRLKQMQRRLDEPLISRRPLPGTLPSDRAVYRGLLALALLGSSPTAMTLSDSRRMNLPKPIVRSSDTILVSRKRLISVLSWLGLITNDIEGRKVVGMIHQLWKEAYEDSTAASSTIKPKNANRAASGTGAAVGGGASDPEAGYSSAIIPDVTELGNLKWTLYGVPRQQKSALFCLPCCGSNRPERMDPEHAVFASGLRPHSGELVRHDVLTCPLCIDLTGRGGDASSCPLATPLSVTTSSLQDNPATMNGGNSSRNNRHSLSNSMSMRDDSASNSNNDERLMIRNRPAALARHGTDYSEADGRNGIFGSSLVQV